MNTSMFMRFFDLHRSKLNYNHVHPNLFYFSRSVYDMSHFALFFTHFINSDFRYGRVLGYKHTIVNHNPKKSSLYFELLTPVCFFSIFCWNTWSRGLRFDICWFGFINNRSTELALLTLHTNALQNFSPKDFRFQFISFFLPPTTLEITKSP